MYSNKINIINITIWFLLLVVPYLLCETKIIDVTCWSVSKENGIVSILTGSFLHASYSHLTSNLSIILLGVSLLYVLYKKHYWWVIIPGILFPSFTMYIEGSETVGISGLAYTLIWFIITAGLISKHPIRFISSIVILLFYGITLKGATPQIMSPFVAPIAWQNHLTGLVLGFLLAVLFKFRSNSYS